MSLTAAALRTAAEKPRTVTRVETPIGEAFVRTMTALERDEAEEACHHGREASQTRLSYSGCLVAACLCDAEGELVFADQAEGRRVLSACDEGIVYPLYAEALRLSGRRKSDQEAVAKKSGTGDGSAT